MAERGRAASLKRPFIEEVEPDEPPMERKVRFPKGKKAKKGDATGPRGEEDEEAFGQWMKPELAAKERTRRRNQIREKELFREQAGAGFRDISHAEVDYEVNATFEDDGIKIEPFNLKQEREEGYFDADENFVEYVNKNEIKDAWLDSVDVDLRLAKKNDEKIVKEEDYQDLSSEDVGKIKRSITNILQPGETVIQALKRLKGNSSDKKERMSEDTKRTFDQLTEYAVKLMENGDYNVYHEKRETFEREAEGYERLARAKEGSSRGLGNGSYESTSGVDIIFEGMGHGAHYSSVSSMSAGPSGANSTPVQVSSSDDGAKFDMFGDEDENASMNPHSGEDGFGSSSTSEPLIQPQSEGFSTLQNLDPEKANGALENDYVFDESSGYYYSSMLGYYYDPASGLYCCATSGKWYSFNEQTGAYDEIQGDGSWQTERITAS